MLTYATGCIIYYQQKLLHIFYHTVNQIATKK